MREIVFRGKSKEELTLGEWIYGYLFNIEGEKAWIWNGIPQEVLTDTVGQYTGVKDRNGTDVWEGDLLRTLEGDIMVVKWVGGGFITSCLKPAIAGLINTNRYAYPVSEVIGNIFDSNFSDYD